MNNVLFKIGFTSLYFDKAKYKSYFYDEKNLNNLYMKSTYKSAYIIGICILITSINPIYAMSIEENQINEGYYKTDLQLENYFSVGISVNKTNLNTTNQTNTTDNEISMSKSITGTMLELLAILALIRLGYSMCYHGVSWHQQYVPVQDFNIVTEVDPPSGEHYVDPNGPISCCTLSILSGIILLIAIVGTYLLYKGLYKPIHNRNSV